MVELRPLLLSLVGSTVPTYGLATPTLDEEKATLEEEEECSVWMLGEVRIKNLLD